ncbi:hypothetical protein F2Q68_00038562 [Brassica cretica]|uniref:Elongator complex protein 2 n=1 Tax=Brassica cretica TaxID=69181 RepID=A0A8S9MDK8_BRACR|nr:hypothetical protein F2Q68_00038562 [Brassica cretica]
MWGKTEVEVMTGLKQDATEWSTTTLGELLVLFPSVPKTPLLFSAQRSLSLFQRLINPSKFDSVCSSFQTAQILTTLPGHKASVNCTHWLPSSKFAFKAKDLDRHYLLSGDTDGIIIIWELFTVNNNWRHVRQLPQSHKKGVTCITAYMVSETDALLLQMEL